MRMLGRVSRRTSPDGWCGRAALALLIAGQLIAPSKLQQKKSSAQQQSLMYVVFVAVRRTSSRVS